MQASFSFVMVTIARFVLHRRLQIGEGYLEGQESIESEVLEVEEGRGGILVVGSGRAASEGKRCESCS